MPKAQVNAVDIYYEIHGQGLPVLFVHGGTGGLGSTLLPREAPIEVLFPLDRVQVIYYDRRSAGQSQYVLEPYTLTDMANDGRGLLDHLGVERSVVIGDSMGGMVAIQYALLYPEKVTGLALLETGAALMSEENLAPGGKGLQNAGRTVREARRLGDRALFEASKERMRSFAPVYAFAKLSPARQKALEERRSEFLAKVAQLSDEELFTYSTGAIRNMEAYYGVDQLPRLGELKMPACIIHGTADANVAFAFAEEMRDRLPQAAFHAVEGGTHGILTYPKAVAALRSWLVALADGTTR